MKQNRTFIASLIACLLAVACLFQLAALNERTTSMERNMSTWMNNMDHRISNISFSVQDTLEEQASLLADSRWEYGDADIPSQTAVLRCAVTPKEFSPAETTASLICGEQAWPMTLENGEFVARITLPLFSDSVVTKADLS